MTNQPDSSTQIKIHNALKAAPGAVLENIAGKLNVPTAWVVSCLPEDQVVAFGADRFEDVMQGLSELGQVTFIVHTDDIVLECKGSVPPGSFSRGYFNIHGDSPIGGHIKASNCQSIYFISRPLMGRDSHSVQFYNPHGACMFKVYLGRDAKRELFPEQVEAFASLKKRLNSHD